MNRDHKITVSQGGIRLDKALALALPELSRARLQALIKAGEVQLGGIPVLATDYMVKEGQEFHLTIKPAVEAKPVAQKIPLKVVFEDEDLLVVDKPAGLVIHPGAGNPHDTMVNALLAHCGESLSGIGGVKRPGIVHRLDKFTSGLVVVAKNDFAHHHLSKQFSSHTILRRYHAIVWGRPNLAGMVNLPIGRSPRNRQKMAVVASGKHAVTHYKVLQDLLSIASLIECRLETGRTHQIRVHMTHLGHPLLSDPLYTKKLSAPFHPILDALKKLPWFGQRQALHALSLGFVHPRSEREMLFESPYPEDFKELLELFAGFKSPVAG